MAGLGCAAAGPLQPSVQLENIHGVQNAAKEAACLQDVESEIQRVPDKQDFHPTTSWQFKRDLARFFCRMAPETLRAMELGVFRGYTTAVLATMFGHVLAVDIESEFLDASAAHNRERHNIAYLVFDSFADDWRVFRANHVDVVFIDADHKYDKVLGDAANALSYLKPASFLVFDDFGMEADVRRAVLELQEADVIRDCEHIGYGKDSQPWELRDFGLVNHTEGVICRRGLAKVSDVPARMDLPYLMYTVNPEDPLLRSQGVLRFKANGGIWTSRWGGGFWRRPAVSEPGEDILNVSLQKLAPGCWEALFNRPRTAFLLTPDSSPPLTPARWFGMRADKVNQVFTIANWEFDAP